MATRNFRISAELLLNMGSGRFEVVGNPLPLDASCVGGRFDYERQEVILEVESKEFAESGDVEPPVIRRIQ